MKSFAMITRAIPRLGGVCMYFCEDPPIKRRNDLEILQETIVAELIFGRKKLFIVTVYRSPAKLLNSSMFS